MKEKEQYHQKRDYEIGDRVKIIYKESTYYGKVGEVIEIVKRGFGVSIRIKLSSGIICSYSYRSSLELVKEKVIFT